MDITLNDIAAAAGIAGSGGDGGDRIARRIFAKYFKVDEYVEIVRRVREAAREEEIALDEGFRKRYCDFFFINPSWVPAGFLNEYFRTLYRLKAEFHGNGRNFGEGRVSVYERLLRRFHDKFCRVERSYVSKLIAVVDTSAPIIDSNVIAYLERSNPEGLKSAKSDGGIAEAVSIYGFLEREYADVSGSAESIEWFRGNLPEEYRGEVTDVKALDFMIWKVLGR